MSGANGLSRIQLKIICRRLVLVKKKKERGVVVVLHSLLATVITVIWSLVMRHVYES